MQCIEISRPGDPEVLQLASRETPRPEAGEILVKVAAAGVNRPDLLQREGKYPPPPGASDIPGLELAGEVVALGDGVSHITLGDKICALVTGGAYAEYCRVAAPLALPVPAGLDMIAAAAIPETYYTVWTNVFERGGLKSGEHFLVHGGSSGIGTTAIQLAAAFGARVYTTVGNADKARACEDLGASRAINYRDEDFVAVVKEETQGQGLDLILDMVGGGYINRNIAALAMEGRLVQIAFMQGAKTQVDLMPMMLKRLTLTGSTLRARSVAQKQVITAGIKKHVWPLLASGKVRPVIHSTFPLSQATAAHTLMETSQHIGKIMLTL